MQEIICESRTHLLDSRLALGFLNAFRSLILLIFVDLSVLSYSFFSLSHASFFFFFFHDAFRCFISNASWRVTICFCNLFTFASRWASQLFFSAVFSPHDCTPMLSFYWRQNRRQRRYDGLRNRHADSFDINFWTSVGVCLIKKTFRDGRQNFWFVAETSNVAWRRARRIEKAREFSRINAWLAKLI